MAQIKTKIKEQAGELKDMRIKLVSERKELIQKIRTMSPTERKGAIENFKKNIKSYIAKKEELKTTLKESRQNFTDKTIAKKEAVKDALIKNWQEKLAGIKEKAITLVKEYRAVISDKTLDAQTKATKIKAIKEKILKLRWQFNTEVKAVRVNRKTEVKAVRKEAQAKINALKEKKIERVKEVIKTKLPILLKAKLYDRISSLSDSRQIMILNKVNTKITAKLQDLQKKLSNVNNNAKIRLELKVYVLNQVLVSVKEKITTLRGQISK